MTMTMIHYYDMKFTNTYIVLTDLCNIETFLCNKTNQTNRQHGEYISL